MGATRNGTNPRTREPGPPRDERGQAMDLATGGIFDTRIGIQDTTRPLPLELEKMLLRDGQCQAVEMGLTKPLKNTKPELEGGSPAARRLVEKALLKNEHEGGMTTPLNMVLDQMDSAITLRRAPFEIVWKEDDKDKSIHTFKKIKLLPVSTCRILPDKNGTFNGFIQDGITITGSRNGEETFNPKKSFVYFHDGARYPLRGRTAFQTAYFDHLDKLKVKRLWYIYLQLFALGIRTGKTQSSSESDHDSLLNRMNRVRGGGNLILGPTEEVEGVDSGSGGADFEKAVSAINREITVSTLLQFLNLGGSEGTGAQSLSEDHHSLFDDMQQGIQSDKQDHVNRYLVGKLVAQNLGPNAAAPKIKLAPIKSDDVKSALARFDLLAAKPEHQVPGPVFNAIMRKAMQSMDIDMAGLEEEIEKAEKTGNIPEPAPGPAPDPATTERETDEAEGGSGDNLSKALRIIRDTGARAPNRPRPTDRTRGVAGANGGPPRRPRGAPQPPQA